MRTIDIDNFETAEWEELLREANGGRDVDRDLWSDLWLGLKLTCVHTTQIVWREAVLMVQFALPDEEASPCP